jgi:hypothetical protein
LVLGWRGDELEVFPLPNEQTLAVCRIEFTDEATASEFASAAMRAHSLVQAHTSGSLVALTTATVAVPASVLAPTLP